MPNFPSALSIAKFVRTKRLSGRSRLCLLGILFIIYYLPRVGLLDPSLVFTMAGTLFFASHAKQPAYDSWYSHGWYIPVLCSLLGVLTVFGLSIFLHDFVSISLNSYYFFRILRTIFLLVFFTAFFSFGSFTERTLLLSIAAILSIHTLIAYLQIVPIESVRNFARALNVMGSVNFTYRAAGLAVGYDLAGILIGLNSVVLWVLLHIEKSNVRKWLTANFVLHLAALLFTSRTGLLLAGFCVMFYSLVFSQNLVGSFFSLLKLSVVGIAVSSTLILIVQLYDPNIARGIFNMAFEIPLNIMKGRGLRTESSDDTFRNHFFLKLDDSNIIFGDPSTVFNANGGFFTDVGYVQILNGHGIFGLCAISFFFIITSMYLISIRPRFPDQNIHVRRLTITFLVVFLLINLKGPYFFSRQAFDCFTILFAYLIGQDCRRLMSRESNA